MRPVYTCKDGNKYYADSPSFPWPDYIWVGRNKVARWDSPKTEISWYLIGGPEEIRFFVGNSFYSLKEFLQIADDSEKERVLLLLASMSQEILEELP